MVTLALLFRPSTAPLEMSFRYFTPNRAYSLFGPEIGRLNRIRRQAPGTPFVRAQHCGESRGGRDWIWLAVKAKQRYGDVGVTGSESVPALSNLTYHRA